VKEQCGFRWQRGTVRLAKYQTPENEGHRREFAEALIALDSLNFELYSLDEFKVNNYMHKNYGWFPPGVPTVIPVAGFWRSFNCLAAVSRNGVALMQVKTENVNSNVFCQFVRDLVQKLREKHGEDLSRVVLVMDGAKYHVSE
jgi:hypothetical protein